MMSYFDVNQSQIRRIWRARRGAIRLGVHRSNLRLWGCESMNNPERPFNLLDSLISQAILFLPSGELLALYIQCVMYLWPQLPEEPNNEQKHRTYPSYDTYFLMPRAARRKAGREQRCHPPSDPGRINPVLHPSSILLFLHLRILAPQRSIPKHEIGR